MFNVLTSIGFGVLTLGIMIAIGLVILNNFAGTLANCGTGYVYNQNSSGYVFTTDKCCNATTSTCSGTPDSTGISTTATTTNTISGYLGTSSGGLATWIPVVIVLSIGLMFLGAFMTRSGKTYA